MKRHGTNKTQALLIHAKRRARARYGIEFDDEELRRLANIIRRGGGVFIERKSLRVTCWRVTFRAVELVVLYDRVRRAIVTFLPFDCYEIRQCNAPRYGPSLSRDEAVM